MSFLRSILDLSPTYLLVSFLSRKRTRRLLEAAIQSEQDGNSIGKGYFEDLKEYLTDDDRAYLQEQEEISFRDLVDITGEIPTFHGWKGGTATILFIFQDRQISTRIASSHMEAILVYFRIHFPHALKLEA